MFLSAKAPTAIMQLNTKQNSDISLLDIILINQFMVHSAKHFERVEYSQSRVPH